jgi:hypothetical protein
MYWSLVAEGLAVLGGLPVTVGLPVGNSRNRTCDSAVRTLAGLKDHTGMKFH